MENIIIIVVATFIGSFVHCLLGFGDALLVMPFLLIFYNLTAADCIANNYAIIIGLILTKYNFHSVSGHFFELFLLIVSYTIMSVVGALVLESINAKFLVIMLGIVLSCYQLLIFLFNKLYKVKVNKFSAVIFGAIAGFFGVTTTINGPPLVLYGQLRRFDKDTFIAILQPVFLWGAILNFYYYYRLGLFNMEFTMIGLATTPLIMLNYYITKWIRNKISEYVFKRIIICVVSISGWIILLKTLIL